MPLPPTTYRRNRRSNVPFDVKRCERGTLEKLYLQAREENLRLRHNQTMKRRDWYLSWTVGLIVGVTLCLLLVASDARGQAPRAPNTKEYKVELCTTVEECLGDLRKEAGIDDRRTEVKTGKR
jgi:hypothetical protein